MKIYMNKIFMCLKFHIICCLYRLKKSTYKRFKNKKIYVNVI